MEYEIFIRECKINKGWIDVNWKGTMNGVVLEARNTYPLDKFKSEDAEQELFMLLYLELENHYKQNESLQKISASLKSMEGKTYNEKTRVLAYKIRVV
jgi:hypothetical protein